MHLADLISTLGLIQGLLLAGLIIAAHKPDRPTRLLGFFILTLSLRILPFLLPRLAEGSTHPEFRWLPLYFLYSSLPLLYLYARRLTGRLRWRRDWLHLIPGAVEIAGLTGLFLADFGQAGPLWSPGVTERVFNTYALLAIGPGALYAYLIIDFLNRSRVGISQYYSDLVGKDLHWLKISVLYLTVFAVVYLFLQFGPLAVDQDTVTITGAVLNTIGIYYITIKGFRQFAVQHTGELEDITSSAPPTPPDGKKGDPPPLFTTVDQYIRTNRAYLDSNLTLGDLSQALHVSQRNLSRVINSGSGQNFNRYINHYRVECAKQFLLDRDYAHYTMEGIAAESGFNSKATFYQAFKQCCDLSPGNYRKQGGGARDAGDVG